MTPEIWTIISVGIAIGAIVIGQGRFNMNVINKRFEGVDKQFEAVDKRFEDVNKQLDGLRNDLAEVRDRVSRVEGSVQTLLQVISERRVA
ncbi:MAG: hypothetical protein OXG25_15545 [Gammaproteobacteria bacterium]|nr:hypothetical protein [Gammaproteobacteria bacterium]